jgi:hypothetical protein
MIVSAMAMTDSEMQDSQDRGEPYRQQLSIDGTAGDAQDISHPFTPDDQSTYCIVCGLSQTWKKHND